MMLLLAGQGQDRDKVSFVPRQEARQDRTTLYELSGMSDGV
jgi:hypothetical protein